MGLRTLPPPTLNPKPPNPKLGHFGRVVGKLVEGFLKALEKPAKSWSKVRGPWLEYYG